MALLGDIQTCTPFVSGWTRRTTMAKKKKLPKMTAEEHAQRERTQEMVRERIAYHEAKAKEEEEAAARERGE
jgi:hypothetical protein